jgi:hypothetical protein
MTSVESKKEKALVTVIPEAVGVKTLFLDKDKVKEEEGEVTSVPGLSKRVKEEPSTRMEEPSAWYNKVFGGKAKKYQTEPKLKVSLNG